MSYKNLITRHLWEDYQSKMNKFKIKNQLILDSFDESMRELVEKIHTSGDSIQECIYGKSKSHLRLVCRNKFGNISYKVNKNGMSSLSIKITVSAYKEYEDRFLFAKVKPLSGYVYFLESEYGVKIGKTRKLKRRMNEFGVQLPFKVNLKCFVQTPDFDKLENQLHKLLKGRRLNGEWFDLEEIDWDMIEDLLLDNNLKMEVTNGRK